MQLITEKCTGCGYCVLVCPYDALKTNGWAELIPEHCTDCNLCVYACPSDCFAPDVPLKPYTPRLKPAYDVVIIGGGVGGLMAGAALARAGRSVAVFEKLGFPGGRYTEIDYKDAAVTTGAWTNLGPKSHIGRFLLELGVNLDYISLEDIGLTEQYTIRFPDGRRYQSLFEMLSPPARKAWLKAISTGRKALAQSKTGAATNKLSLANDRLPGDSRQSPLTGVSTAAYIAEFCDDPDLLAVVDAIVAATSGLRSAQMPAGEYIQIMLDGREAGRQFAMPAGGVRSIIKALTTTLRQAGGQLFVRSPVEKILIDSLPRQAESDGITVAPKGSERVAAGIRLTDGREVSSRVVLHNGGPSAFVKLAGPENLPQDYVDRIANLKGVECAALFCAARTPLFNDAPMTMTPNCRRVVGVFTPTLLDPSLSKEGLHLFDAFFPTYSDDRVAELNLALADMRDLFPHFDDVVEWMVPMFFTGIWPGTETGQTFGQTGDNRLDPATPLQNCFLVGMDVQGSGVAGDLIPVGVRRALDKIEHL